MRIGARKKDSKLKDSVKANTKSKKLDRQKFIKTSEIVRKIYQEQHKKKVNTDGALDRFIKIYSTKFFKLPKNYFRDKRVLDAGCGSTGYFLIAINKIGCKDIHGIDLGKKFIPTTKKSLENYNISLNEITLKSGNVLKIPYDDNYFDFTSCNGVLAHLNSLNEAKKAISELSRVTKPNGYMFISSGGNNSTAGLLEIAIVPAIRNYYNTNKNFKRFIDDLTPNDFFSIMDFISKKMRENTNEKINFDKIKPLFDSDFCLTIQDVLQTPLRQSFPENFIIDEYKKNNFKNIKRLKKYIERKNIRKFTAPLHYYSNNKISKLLYGTGYLEYIGKKIK